MAKKQFIRHLEYYGFPDQNNYSSDIGGVDLSDLREKDKEHDTEIAELEGDKADKKDLVELSGTVENLIDTQSQINASIVESINGITSDIETLKEIDNEYGEQLSSITDSINDVIGDINDIDDRIDELDEAKLGKDEADTLYAKKDDVYTKEEVDELLDIDLGDYATKEWVESQGYLTEVEGDSRYATVSSLNDVSARLDDEISALASVSGELSSFEEGINLRLDGVESEFGALESKVESELASMSGVVDSFDGRIETNSNDIANLSQELDGKADKSAVEALSSELDDKVDKSEFETYKGRVSNSLNNLDEKKADKTALSALSNDVSDLSDRLNQEISDRESGDANLQTQITSNSNDIADLKESDAYHNERLTNLETGLTKEISDREQGDLKLLGSESDYMDSNTIWGAKKYAVYQKSIAIEESNFYTDEKFGELSSALEDEHNWAEQNFSSGASKQYVDSKVNEAKSELVNKIDEEVGEEEDRARAAESNIISMVSQNASDIRENDQEIDHISNRLNAITAWDGTDPDEYVNTGNGVLDVLHREFHEFEETHGSIKEIKVEDDNLIIVYYTKYGEQETIIPIPELVDLSDYYTKEEVDSLISQAIADYYTKQEIDTKLEGKANVSDIDALEDRIEDNTTSIDTLFNKLGYANNNTLNTTNPREVAFGSYNVSQTGDEPKDRTVFSIGNGFSNSERSNALEVRENGDVYMWIEGEYIQINNLLGMLAHEVY